jgi:hypothetical protein
MKLRDVAACDCQAGPLHGTTGSTITDARTRAFVKVASSDCLQATEDPSLCGLSDVPFLGIDYIGKRKIRQILGIPRRQEIQANLQKDGWLRS